MKRSSTISRYRLPMVCRIYTAAVLSPIIAYSLMAHSWGPNGLLAKLLGQFRRAPGGGMQCLFDQGFEAAGLEGLDRGFGGAGRRGDAAAQFAGIDITEA